MMLQTDLKREQKLEKLILQRGQKQEVNEHRRKWMKIKNEIGYKNRSQETKKEKN